MNRIDMCKKDMNLRNYTNIQNTSTYTFSILENVKNTTFLFQQITNKFKTVNNKLKLTTLNSKFKK